MFQFTLADAREQRCVKIAAGSCINSPEFISMVNEGQRLLCKRGNWFGMEWLVRFCLDSNCIVWPRFVGTVLGLRFCNTWQPAFMQNQWYAILGPYAQYDFTSGTTVRDNGTAPCHSEIRDCDGTGKLVRYVVTKRPDLGKTCKIYGIDANGQPLQERDDATGTWTDGVTIVAANPFGTTSVYVRHITSVVREATQGPAWLYEYDPVADKQRQLANFDPNETNPRRRRSTITNWNSWWGLAGNAGGCNDDAGNRIVPVDALIKLEFVPVQTDGDFLMVDDFDALALAIRAIRRGEADEDAGRESALLLAVKEMNMRERDKLPGNQTTVLVQAVGSYPMYNPI